MFQTLQMPYNKEMPWIKIYKIQYWKREMTLTPFHRILTYLLPFKKIKQTIKYSIDHILTCLNHSTLLLLHVTQYLFLQPLQKLGGQVFEEMQWRRWMHVRKVEHEKCVSSWKVGKLLDVIGCIQSSSNWMVKLRNTK